MILKKVSDKLLEELKSKLLSPELQKCYFLYVHKQIQSKVPILFSFIGPKRQSGNCYVAFSMYWKNSFDPAMFTKQEPTAGFD